MIAKRTQILVDPKVQWAIARRIVLHWCCFVIGLVTVNVMLRMMFTISDESLAESLRRALVAQMSLVVVMLTMLPMFLLDTMKLSNRFAGPMYRIRTALVKIPGGGPMAPLKFRTGDFWQEVAEDFNLVVRQHEALRRRNAELEAELVTLRQTRELQVQSA